MGVFIRTCQCILEFVDIRDHRAPSLEEAHAPKCQGGELQILRGFDNVVVSRGSDTDFLFPIFADVLHVSHQVRPLTRDFDDAESPLADDRNVAAAIIESLDFTDPRHGSDTVDSVTIEVVGVGGDDPELRLQWIGRLGVRQKLPVPGFEDVQRQHQRWHEDQVQWEQGKLLLAAGHGLTVRRCASVDLMLCHSAMVSKERAHRRAREQALRQAQVEAAARVRHRRHRRKELARTAAKPVTAASGSVRMLWAPMSGGQTGRLARRRLRRFLAVALAMLAINIVVWIVFAERRFSLIVGGVSVLISPLLSTLLFNRRS